MESSPDALRGRQTSAGVYDGAGRVESGSVVVGPSYGRGLPRFRKNFFVLGETILRERRALP
jgi:hypothetical protein